MVWSVFLFVTVVILVWFNVSFFLENFCCVSVMPVVWWFLTHFLVIKVFLISALASHSVCGNRLIVFGLRIPHEHLRDLWWWRPVNDAPLAIRISSCSRPKKSPRSFLKNLAIRDHRRPIDFWPELRTESYFLNAEQKQLIMLIDFDSEALSAKSLHEHQCASGWMQHKSCSRRSRPKCW